MNKRTMKKGLAIVLALVMVFAMTATAFASTNTGTATIGYYVYYKNLSTPDIFDSQTAAAGANLYTVVKTYSEDPERGYEPTWITGTDPYNGDTTYYLDSMLGASAENVSHQYNADGSGWSIDWGWTYTVNGSMPYYTLTNPCHYKAMNQYTIQAGDDIKVMYACYKTEWDSAGNTVFTILDPATV